MLAVRVTDRPYVEGLGVELILIEVPARLTAWLRPFDVAGAKLLSPPYEAIIVCDPALRATVLNLAWPEPFSAPVPSVDAPSEKVTVPVGTPPDAVTVAVKVTD